MLFRALKSDRKLTEMSVLFCSSKLLTSGPSGSINTIGALFEQEVIHELGLY